MKNIENTNWEVRFREKFWWKYSTPADQPKETNKFSASECEMIIDFIRTEIEAAKKEGYEQGYMEAENLSNEVQIVGAIAGERERIIEIMKKYQEAIHGGGNGRRIVEQMRGEITSRKCEKCEVDKVT